MYFIPWGTRRPILNMNNLGKGAFLGKVFRRWRCFWRRRNFSCKSHNSCRARHEEKLRWTLLATLTAFPGAEWGELSWHILVRLPVPRTVHKMMLRDPLCSIYYRKDNHVCSFYSFISSECVPINYINCRGKKTVGEIILQSRKGIHKKSVILSENECQKVHRASCGILYLSKKRI